MNNTSSSSSSSNSSSPAVGTSSKQPNTQHSLSRSRSNTPPRSYRARDHNHGPPPQQSIWKTLRWILFGFGVGTATTALFYSVNIPTIRVEFEYADAPTHHHLPPPKSGAQVSTSGINLKFSTAGGNTNKNAADEMDDGVKQEDDTVETEQEEDHNSLQEADHPDDSELMEEAANASSKDELPAAAVAGRESEYKPSDDEPDFSNPGPPPKLDQAEAFAACILIKDDNHWLIEWLAYHYHVMPLRYLIVAIDPDSKTSPIPILKRYKNRNLMTIGIWGDEMFMPKKINANPRAFDNNTELMLHRVRQNNFYFKCIRTFKQRSREWLMLIDTDEYIVTNYASGLYYNITKNIPITKPGNVLTFIKQHHQLTAENHTCSYMPRYMFGIKESKREMVQRHTQNANLNGNDFLTQRFQFRNPRRMHNGKNLINIRKLPEIKQYTSVHHVSSYCPDPNKMRTVNHVKKSLVRVHHYLGTEEQYFFRTDPRGAKVKNITATSTAVNATSGAKPKPKKASSHAYFTRGKKRYQNLNKGANYPDQGARAWIKGFINDVGVETARALLKGVGQVGYEGEPDEI